MIDETSSATQHARVDGASVDGASVDGARVRFFPPALPLIAILSGLVVDQVWPISFGIDLPAPARYAIGGGVALGAVCLLGFWSVFLFRKSGQDENPWKPTPHIETAGPFKLTRNPMYLQMVLVCIGIAVATANWWILFLTPPCGLALQELAIKPEEHYLERKFGMEYRDYKARVRRWI